MDDQGVSQAEAMLLADLKHSDEVHSATNRIEKSRDMLQKCVQQQRPHVLCLSHPPARACRYRNILCKEPSAKELHPLV